MIREKQNDNPEPNYTTDQCFIEGFVGFSDQYVAVWWGAVQDLKAPRLTVEKV